MNSDATSSHRHHFPGLRSLFR